MVGGFGLWFRFAQQIEQIVCADGTLLTHQAQHFEALRRQGARCAARRVFQLAPVTCVVVLFLPCSTSNGMKAQYRQARKFTSPDNKMG